MPDFAAFALSLWILLRDTLKRWLTWISAGLASLVSWVTYAGNVPAPARPFTYAVAAILLLLAFAWTFHLLRLERDTLLDDRKPKLEIVFEPTNEEDSRPYLQTLRFSIPNDQQTFGEPDNVPMRDRRYRIGVRNLSGLSIPYVSVTLVACEPPGDFIHIGHRLLVMDTDPPMAHAVLLPSATGQATLMFDVVNEFGPEASGPRDHFMFCYANPNLTAEVQPNTYIITLRADGGNVSATRRFRIRKPWDPTAGPGRLMMEAV